jgi:hypothetical protein
MTVDTRKLEWLMVNQDESAVLGRQKGVEADFCRRLQHVFLSMN